MHVLKKFQVFNMNFVVQGHRKSQKVSIFYMSLLLAMEPDAWEHVYCL